MAGISENNRLRVAAALLGLSVVLILVGFAIILQHTDVPVVLHGPAASRPAPIVHHRAQASLMRQLLFWLLVLVMIFTVSTLAFLRWSRSFRRWVFHKPRPSTPSEDVWAMHKLPEGAVEEWDDGPGPPDVPKDNR